MDSETGKDGRRWYVLRDLRRANAKEAAYRELLQAGLEVFTPLRERVAVRAGRRIREEVPLVRDLLFVRALREELDPEVEKRRMLQYRYVKGGRYQEPMTVPEREMERFIRAVSVSAKPRYYLPGELTAGMCGRMIRMVGGPLDGYEGRLLTIRGSKTRRLLVELPGFFSVGVEIEGSGDRSGMDMCTMTAEGKG